MRQLIARLLAGLLLGTLTWFVQAADLALTPTARACELIGTRLQSVQTSRCLDADLQTNGGTSLQGFPLLYRDYLPGRSRRTPYRVMLVGGIHGDELTSVSIVFGWMDKLAKERLQPFHWRVIPSLNPDGLLKRPSSRQNAAGVDLNRNFPTANWDAEALDDWVNKAYRDPRRYPGPRSLSEPESRWLVRQIRDFQPDALITIHAPLGILDYDGPLEPPQRFGFLRLQPIGIYPGSLGNYVGVDLRIPTITLELPYAGLMPTAAQSQRIWADMLTWLELKLPQAEAPLYRRPTDTAWQLPQFD
ncbi:MAG: M14 family murein peptide amidase A [Panacagrimonas sp.]